MAHTRNFPEFKGQKFEENGSEFTFLMKNPKKEAFIYEVKVIRSSQEVADLEAVKNFFVIGWEVRDALKFINKKLGGKLEGESKTTCSGYTKLHDGRRVRISDHSAIASRSKSDIEFILNYRSNSIVNHEGTRVFTATKNSTPQELFEALVESIKNFESND